MASLGRGQRRFYDRIVLLSLLPATGWQAVYHGKDGTHYVTQIYALALIARRWYDAETQEVAPLGRWDGQEDEEWEIVGLDYSPTDDWNVANEDSNYCGLLPPEWTLAEFEARKRCQHQQDAAEAG